MRRATVVDAAHFVAIVISIHALHEESDVGRGTITARPRIFQSTLSMRRATYLGIDNSTTEKFQSTLSMRRATRPVYRPLFSHLFQSTLSMRRATKIGYQGQHEIRISIHALHEESDYHVRANASISSAISIHALHEESDLILSAKNGVTLGFQSTLSMRRATIRISLLHCIR